jgi:hypothetical protein
MIELSCLSWLSFNIKRKTEEGHCRNPGHDLKDGITLTVQKARYFMGSYMMIC